MSTAGSISDNTAYIHEVGCLLRPIIQDQEINVYAGFLSGVELGDKWLDPDQEEWTDSGNWVDTVNGGLFTTDLPPATSAIYKLRTFKINGIDYANSESVTLQIPSANYQQSAISGNLREQTISNWLNELDYVKAFGITFYDNGEWFRKSSDIEFVMEVSECHGVEQNAEYITRWVLDTAAGGDGFSTYNNTTGQYESYVPTIAPFNTINAINEPVDCAYNRLDVIIVKEYDPLVDEFVLIGLCAPDSNTRYTLEPDDILKLGACDLDFSNTTTELVEAGPIIGLTKLLSPGDTWDISSDVQGSLRSLTVTVIRANAANTVAVTDGNGVTNLPVRNLSLTWGVDDSRNTELQSPTTVIANGSAVAIVNWTQA